MYSDDRICTLGVPTGVWKESGKGRLEAWEDPSLSKIGGYAVWHDKESAPRLEELSCGVCGSHSKVVLVAQIYAPTEDWARSLYLFCCNSLDCSQRHEAWTVIRNQRPIDNSASVQQTSPAPTHTQAHTQTATHTQTHTQTPTPSKSSVWDFLADDNFGSSSSAGEQDLFDLLAMRDLNISSNSNNNSNNNKTQTPAKASKANNTVAATESKRELPFLLTETALPVCKVKESDEDWEAAMDDDELLALPAKGVDAAHIDSLISRYLRDEDDQENLHVLHSVGFGQASGAATSSVQIEEDDENEDEDEESRREQKNDRKSKTELYFQKRTSVEPRQVLRYAYEGEPLWITSPSPLEGEKAVSVPQCAICGESRVFECQLMPAILSGISRLSKQSAKKKSTGGVEGQARTVRDLFGDELDFGVAAVWSCPNSCCGDASTPCKEFVVVQPPPDAA